MIIPNKYKDEAITFFARYDTYPPTMMFEMFLKVLQERDMALAALDLLLGETKEV